MVSERKGGNPAIRHCKMSPPPPKLRKTLETQTRAMHRSLATIPEIDLKKEVPQTRNISGEQVVWQVSYIIFILELCTAVHGRSFSCPTKHDR